MSLLSQERKLKNSGGLPVSVRLVLGTDAGLAADLRRLLDTLVYANLAYLQDNPGTPKLYQSGCRYRREPRGREEWLSIPFVLEQKYGDCEDLAAWRVAEALALKNRARIELSKRGNVWHVTAIVNGVHEDPSRILGM